ncbi:LysR family transcriptional regulator [Vibrio mediterranei]|jgi:DNA-binding transcriptional LysR family regulator|uniref:LysR family transcriptional regulator n=1 Tax=Vibrio barjaei TaxID=1676683 RepID=A0ABW7IMN0_9VIBR|nr:LysR family transcriptional regulator [Vibrio barjaei]OIN27582.1 LysR family transcriptional regulator [Vibrio barjaei]
MLNIEQLVAFVAAAEQGSFSAAARHLGKSQSSVSIGVNNLEVDLGITLFDRSTKYPKLTPQGERMLSQAKVLLRQAERIRNYSQASVDSVEDTLKIAIDPLLPFTLLESAIEKMSQRFPFTQVDVSRIAAHNLTNAIIKDEVELGFNLAADAVPEGLDFVSIANVEWVCICSPDSIFADMQQVSNETLIGERQIVCRSMMQNTVLQAQGAFSQDIWQADDQEDVIKLVEQGIGWAIVPKDFTVEKQAMGTLIDFRPEFQRYEMMNSADVLWKSNTRLGPAAKYLCEMLGVF